jgi:hypothetical protein
MNENSARFAIRDFIEAQASYMCETAVAQGVPRVIDSVSVSLFSEPTRYPFIRVTCADAKEGGFSANVWAPHPVYSMEVLVTDQAMLQGADPLPYETMDVHFRDMCDRLIDKLLLTRRFTYGNRRFVLPEDDNMVSKENQDGIIYSENNTVEALILGSIIRFTLEGC